MQTLEEQLLDEFARRLEGEFEEKLAELDPDLPLAEDAALAEVMLGYLEEAGLVSEHELAPHEDQTGRRRCRVLGYSLPEDSTRLDIFTARLASPGHEGMLGQDELARLLGRAARFFEYSAKKEFDRFAGNDLAKAAACKIFEELARIEDVRVHALTNARVRDRLVEEVSIEGRRVEFSVWDLDRLYRAAGEEVTRERIEIDFTKLLGRPLACLEMKPPPAEYQTFLVVLPGELVFQLYQQYGARLFEFNVRSFLQAKGQVNKGIRETIRREPERFLAYNNGLTATADEIDAGMFHGEMVIRRLKGLQIVNGAQTTASIHWAKKIDKSDISRVAVAMKLTRVEPSKLTEFVPLIARFANTQNPMQLADLSANNAFHIRLEQLSEKIWCPGEESRWFYERARGAYQVARARYGTTPAKRRDFDRECPKAQRFGKTDLAKYCMSWWQHSQIVSKGAQKNFSAFMIALRERFGADWEPTEEFYKETIVQALLFKAAQASVRRAKLESYGANVVTYLVSKLGAHHEVKIDFEFIWDTQDVSPELTALFDNWAPLIHRAIVEGAGKRNVTEFCKKDECWDRIAALDLPLPAKSIPEFDGVAHDAGIARPQAATNEDIVGKCCTLDGSSWARVIAWASDSARVSPYDRRVAHTIAGYAMAGWQRRPTIKQARFGVRVLEAAKAAGVV